MPELRKLFRPTLLKPPLHPQEVAEFIIGFRNCCHAINYGKSGENREDIRAVSVPIIPSIVETRSLPRMTDLVVCSPNPRGTRGGPG